VVWLLVDIYEWKVNVLKTLIGVSICEVYQGESKIQFVWGIVPCLRELGRTLNGIEWFDRCNYLKGYQAL